jgi:hypothetical protein
MALFLVQFATPILAAYGLNNIIKSKSNNDTNASKIATYFLYGSVGFLVLGFIYSILFKESYF